MKKTLMLLCLTIIATTTFAYRIKYGNNIIISQPVYEDLYIAGGTITINAPIHGDLICAGGTIIINDTVTNDILVAGGKITFNGFVGDDIRCAGGELVVQKNITGDLVIAGGKVTVNKNVVIGDGLLLTGGDISFNGTVKNNVKAAAGNVVFTGIAEKDIDIHAGKLEMDGVVNGTSIIAAGEIIIGNNASFNNNVRYWNKSGSLNFKSSVKSGNAVYDSTLKMQTGRWYYFGGITVLAMLWYVGMALLMIGIIQYLFRNVMQKAGDTVFNKTLKSLGFGLLFFIAVPIASVIAFVTVIGVPIGLFLLFNFIVIAMLASVVSAVVAANWLNNRNNYNWSYWKLVFAALGIFIVFKMISLIPFFGGLIILLILSISFGAILLNIKWKRKEPSVANVSV